jgi:hypothetical protein
MPNYRRSFVAPALTAPPSILAIAYFGKCATEKFIHYQRMIEVFYMLEMGYIAFRKTPQLLVSPLLEIPRNAPPR